MAFWSDKNLPEPHRQNRWYIIFNWVDSYKENIELEKYAFALKECKKPEYKIEVSEHYLLNDIRRFPKRLSWMPINVKMVSAKKAKGSLAEKLYDMLTDTETYWRNSVDSTGYDDIDVVSGISKTGSIFESVKIIQVNADGEIIEVWVLTSAFITGVNFGTLTYEQEGFVEISFDITYDNAFLDKTNIVILDKSNDSIPNRMEMNVTGESVQSYKKLQDAQNLVMGTFEDSGLL